jgi:hypothetical protein
VLPCGLSVKRALMRPEFLLPAIRCTLDGSYPTQHRPTPWEVSAGNQMFFLAESLEG